VRRLGYPEDDVPTMVSALKARALWSERERLVRETIRHYPEGLITESQLEANLAAAVVTPPKRQLLLDLADLLAKREAIMDDIRILREAARRGILDVDELRSELRRLGVSTWRIEQVVRWVELRKLRDPEVTRRLTPAQLGRLYELKILTHADLLRRLQLRNYPPDQAELFARLYVPLKEQNQIEEYLKAGIIAKEYAYERLLEIGVRPADARSLVERWERERTGIV